MELKALAEANPNIVKAGLPLSGSPARCSQESAWRGP